jgi:transcriptional regulator with XRE-family HTH domain
MHPNIGRVIWALRRERGIRQKELADLADLKQPNLSRIEAGNVAPRKATLVKIANAFKMDYKELVSDKTYVDLEARWGTKLNAPIELSRPAQSVLNQLPVFNTLNGYHLTIDSNGCPAGEAGEMVSIPGLSDRAFGIRVYGDAMRADGGRDSFYHGDIVMLDEAEPVPGCFALVQLKTGFVFRKYLFDELGVIRLVALNPHYPEIVAQRAERINVWVARRLLRSYDHS